jgi:aspartate/methionine/tyrosine aminotransferase
MNELGFVAAARMRGLDSPASLAISGRVQELRRQGREIINFGSRGDTPSAAKQAAIEMLETGTAAGYTDMRGLAELRAMIAAKLRDANQIQANPDTDIIVSVGGMEGIFSTLLALVDHSDEVLITDPGWLGFEPMVRITGATPVRVPLGRDDGFRLSVESLRERITARTKLLMLCNPDNPTGAVLSRSELEAIAELARERNLLVLMDEAYENFTYDRRAHVSLASLEGMRRRTITVQTVSKIYNMFGWRVGWVVADAEIIKPILAVHSCSVGCPTSFAQAGAVSVLRDTIGQGDRPIAEIVRNYQSQRDAMVRALNGIPRVTCPVPEGAYFVFPKFDIGGMSSVALCTHLLEIGGVATTPGSAFGAAGEGQLRLVFNASVEEIGKGVERIADVLAGL